MTNIPTTINNTMAGALSTVVAQSQAYTVTAGGTGAAGQIFATNNNSGPWLAQNTLSVDQSGTIDLRGDKADIRVNGESMMETLRAIQDRLNILRPNPELEAEWDELQALGEQYRILESKLKEKSKMWNTLKK